MLKFWILDEQIETQKRKCDLGWLFRFACDSQTVKLNTWFELFPVSGPLQFFMLNQCEMHNILNQEDIPIEPMNVCAKRKLSFQLILFLSYLLLNKVLLLVVIFPSMCFHSTNIILNFEIILSWVLVNAWLKILFLA